MNKREAISVNKSLKKEYVGDYIILSTKLSLACLSSYHFFRCIYTVLSVNNLYDSNILLEVIALLIILSFIPILYIYIESIKYFV